MSCVFISLNTLAVFIACAFNASSVVLLILASKRVKKASETYAKIAGLLAQGVTQ